MAKRLIVLGNGFDLDLGLRTSYFDFLNSDIFDGLKGRVGLASWLHNSKPEYSRWMDVEVMLGQYACRNGDATESFFSDYKELRSALMRYIDEAETNCVIDNHSIGFKLINDYFDGQTIVANFNYTSTVERVLCGLNRSADAARVLHVHGSVKGGEVIFGVQDSVPVPQVNSFVYKAHSRIFNPGELNLPALLEMSDEIVFFGHSLGPTDYSYFSDFFRSISFSEERRRKIKFYIYDDDHHASLTFGLNFMTKNRISLLRTYNDVSYVPCR